eukprot:3941845-Rhodomonas_salina.1
MAVPDIAEERRRRIGGVLPRRTSPMKACTRDASTREGKRKRGKQRHGERERERQGESEGEKQTAGSVGWAEPRTGVRTRRRGCQESTATACPSAPPSLPFSTLLAARDVECGVWDGGFGTRGGCLGHWHCHRHCATWFMLYGSGSEQLASPRVSRADEQRGVQSARCLDTEGSRITLHVSGFMLHTSGLFHVPGCTLPISCFRVHGSGPRTQGSWFRIVPACRRESQRHRPVRRRRRSGSRAPLPRSTIPAVITSDRIAQYA